MSRLDEATEEQLRKMLRLLGTYEYADHMISYFLRWAEGTQPRPLPPAVVVSHMEMIGRAGE